MLILTWQELYHLWFKVSSTPRLRGSRCVTSAADGAVCEFQQEVKYAIMGQVARGFWGKITWRRRDSTFGTAEDEEKKKDDRTKG